MGGTDWIGYVYLSPDAGDADSDGIPLYVELLEGRNPAVKDNDVFSSARLFAMQMPRDYSPGEGDPAGITYWTNQIIAGTPRAQVLEAYLTTAYYFDAHASASRLYFAILNRYPDYSGLEFNGNQLHQGMALSTLANFFVYSPEFFSIYGSPTDAQFVTLLFNNALFRAPSPSDLSFYVNLLGTGTTRGQVAVWISESAEGISKLTNAVNVSMLYASMLRRTPDSSGFTYFLGLLNGGTTRTSVIGTLIGSAEYHLRFLP